VPAVNVEPAGGRVVDSQGRPVAGAKVTLRPYTIEEQPAFAETTSDENGQFKYPPGTPGKDLFYLQLSAPGFVTDRWIGNHRVHVVRHGRRAPDVLRLDRVHTIVGRVIGPGGKPLPGVPLACDFFNDRVASINRYRLVSDAEGRFRQEGLPAGELFIRYEPSLQTPDSPNPVTGSARFAVAHTTAADGGDLPELTLDLARADCVLEGQLVDARGVGIAQATIRAALAISAARLDHAVETTTDGEGRFRIDGLPPAEFLVSASQRLSGGLGVPQSVQLNREGPTTVHLTGYTPGTAPPRDRRREPDWGSTAGGLQAAIVVLPDKQAYSISETIDVRLLVRNVTDEAIEFSDTFGFNRLHVYGPDGRGRQLDFRHFTGRPWSEQYRLSPGEEVLLKGSFQVDLSIAGDTASDAMFDLSVEPGATYRLVISVGDGFDNVPVTGEPKGDANGRVSGSYPLKIEEESDAPPEDRQSNASNAILEGSGVNSAAGIVGRVRL
jgi:hypothetical protein